jgi:hypothetical protein
MTFERDKEGDYTSDFRASLTVKIGTDARKLTFSKSTKYHSDEYEKNEKGERVLVKKSYHEDIIGINPYTHPFEDLEKVSIAVDVKALVAEYTGMLDFAIADQKRIKQEKFEKAYKNAWIHNGLNEVLNSKKYIPEVTVTKSEMGKPDNYSNNQYLALTLTYKEKKATITKEVVTVGGGGRLYGGSHETRFKLYGNITPGYNGRYYRTLETCLVKFMAMVDESIAIQNATLTRAQKEQKEREDRAEELSKIFGYPIAIQSKDNYDRNYRGGRGNGTWKSYSYYIKVMAVEEKETTRLFLVSEDYRNSEKDIKTYTLAGLKGLTPEKVKAIVKIATE